MNKFLWPVVLVCWLCPTNLGAQSTPYYQSHFPPEEFKARWERIFERLGTNGVAVVQGMAQVNGFIFPRQNNEFYYLCGIEKYDPDAYELLDDFYGGRIEISK